jgi:hypothetical protein
MPSRRERLLDSHLAQLETTETRAARRIAAAYDQARGEISAALISAWNTAGIDTPEQAAARLRQLALLDQIDGRLRQLEREAGVILRGILSAASEQAIEQVRRELALLPAGMRPADTLMFASINQRMVEQFAPVALDGLRVSTTDLGLTLRRELQTGLLQGEAFPVLVGRLMRNVPEGEGPALFPRARTSAMLATRRAVITAENAAKVAAIGEVAAQVPLVRKQAIAAIGKNTTDCCIRVHGQIKPNDEPFELVGEPRFADRMMAPSFHWNCRTAVAMYHPAFEESMPTEKLRADALSELERRKKERREQKLVREETGSTRRRREERSAADDRRGVAEEARQVAEAESRREELIDLAAEEEAPAVVEEEAQPQGLQYQATSEQTAVVAERVDQVLDRIAQRRGIDRGELEAAIDAAFKKLTSSHDMAIQFSSEHIDSLLTDGRFKTQFESGSSGGTLNTKIRSEAEEKGLGAPLDLPAPERAIYGFLDLGAAARENVAQYGDLTFLLKDEARARTTVTMDDSLANFKQGLVAGTPIDAPSKASWDGHLSVLYEYGQDGNANAIADEIPYVEVQIQRGATLSDVRAVVDRNGGLSAAQRKALQDRGIEIWDK